MGKFKLILLSLFATLLLGAVRPALAFDLFGNGVCYTTDSSGNKVPVKDSKGNPPSACQQAKNEGGDKTNRITGPKNIINVTTNILALITGIAAVIMIIVSGFAMVTSAGNSEAVTNARRRIIAALGGLVIVALAWTIIRFVTDNVIK